jgi:hypothetical protein
MVAWSAPPDDKLQTKYPKYPREVKEQIKGKKKLRRKGQMS